MEEKSRKESKNAKIAAKYDIPARKSMRMRNPLLGLNQRGLKERTIAAKRSSSRKGCRLPLLLSSIVPKPGSLQMRTDSARRSYKKINKFQ